MTSRLMGISSQIFIQTTCREPGVITWVQFLDGLPPKIWEGKKTVQNFSRFLTTFDFDREYLRNRSTNRKSEKQLINYNPPTLDEKNTVNFGPQTKKLLTCILAHPSRHFSGDHISALRGCCAPKIFTRATDWPRVPSAHPNWDGGPPNKILIVKI